MAFSSEGKEGNEQSSNDLKSTIVIEHLIQASDVAHTMQHWHVYQKWNKKLFLEMTKAYKEGRMDRDPASGWYKGELWFFDNYVIPLAKKLFECQVESRAMSICSTPWRIDVSGRPREKI